MITGDDRAQISLDLSGGYIVGDVGAHGPAVFRTSDHNESEGGATLNMAHLIGERFQWGASLPFRYRSIEQHSTETEAQGLGDFRLNLAYEILPEWSYSPWRPKGYIFVQQTFPTGKSLYESQDPQVVDAFGKGVYATSSGLLFLKNWKYFDANVLASAQYSYARKFDDLEVRPVWSAQAAAGVGLTPERGPVRLGMRISPQYQQPKKTNSSLGLRKSAYQLVWDTGFDIGFSLSPTSSLTASYTDQTLIGPAKNTTLARTVALNFQYRWQR